MKILEMVIWHMKNLSGSVVVAAQEEQFGNSGRNITHDTLHDASKL